MNFAHVKSMDDNCGEWVECMGMASGCGEQEVGVASGSGWNLWVWLLGVVVRRYIDFLILLIPTPLVSFLFYSSIPTFCSFFKMFFVLVPVLLKITFYVLNNFFAQYKHTYPGFLSGFGPRGGKTAICNLVGGHGSQHAQQGGARVSLGGENAPPRPPLKETLHTGNYGRPMASL